MCACEWGKVINTSQKKYKYTIISEREALRAIKFFMEVSIAKRPFEHILWPQVFNFR